MHGFSNASLNIQITIGILSHIINKVLECIELMRKDCELNSLTIPNNEIAIRDYLFSNYLNNDTVMRAIDFDEFRFSSEVPENYVNSKPQGRADLQVYSIDEFRHRERYFIFECKRIAGDLTLNRKYIDEGIRRFVGKMPKYTSYYKINCMLGFVVKNIDISKNTKNINDLLKKEYTDINVQHYLQSWSIPYTYISSHGETDNERIILIHIFQNCTSLIR